MKKWSIFCKNWEIDPFNPSENDVIRFLTISFNEGASYGSLNSHRSAISHISLNKIGDRDIINKFLKACFNLRPTQSKYAISWDVNLVLDFFENLEDNEVLSLKMLTFKCVVLLALCTAQRLHTLSTIKLKDICFSGNKMIIKITGLTKTAGPGRAQPVLEIEKFPERPKLCLFSCITKYLHISRPLRKDETVLFVSYKTHKPVGSQTLSKWIRLILKQSGVNSEYFSGYSTRHAATSKVFAKGLDIGNINKTAGWSGNSLMFAKHYNRPIDKDNTFAALLLSRN